MQSDKKDIIFAEERRNKIISLLKENSKMLVPEFCTYFSVSPATIRNDLRKLSSQGLINRTHGGAISKLKTKYELDSYQKEVKCIDEKKAIALFAADLVEDGDTIAVDTGTTTMEFVKQLINKNNLTIVTNDIEIAGYIEEQSSATVVLIGGIVRKNFHCTIGPLALDIISKLNVDKAFMAANGLSETKGLTTPDLNQAEVKKAMSSISTQVIVLCDSSKIGNVSFVQAIPLHKISRIVTDCNADEKAVSCFRDQDIIVDLVQI